MGLEVYLDDPGDVPGIGPERGKQVRDGISRFVSPHGSVRYVMYVDGEPVSALQIVTRDGRNAIVANVYTVPDERHRGLAASLLRAARHDFEHVVHAKEEMLSEEGKRWIKRVK